MDLRPDYQLLNLLLEGCQVVSPEYRYLYVNETVCRQGKKTKQELLGQSMTEVYPGIEETPMFQKLTECLETRRSVELENQFLYPDGTTGWFLLKMEPIPEGVFILSIDISATKASEHELRKSIQRIEALREIDIAIIGTTNTSVALKTVLEKVTEVLNVDAASILLFNPHSNTLNFAAGRGYSTKGIEKTRLLLGQGHAGRSALKQVTVVVPDLQESKEEFARWVHIDHEGFVSFAVTPLTSRGKLLGVLEVFHRSRLRSDEPWVEFFEALAGQASIAIDSGRLFQELSSSNLDLMLAYETTIEGWSKALDLRDKETEGHTLRVTELTVKLAQSVGIPEHDIVHVRRGALLHDIGKMGIPDSILLKPGRLTEEEWTIMKKHPVFARDLLYPIEYLRPALPIPYSHHERFDGTGYPQHLTGDQIPLPARLFAVVDVWDALCFDRPYRKAWPQDQVREYIHGLKGSHFDPEAVEAFWKVMKELS